jgi:flagellar FliL protein
MADDKSKEGKDAAPAAPAAAAVGGGFKAMLPLMLTVVLMPVLAFAMTQFILVPKLQQAITASAATIDPGGEGEESEAAGAETQTGGHGETGAAPIPKGAKATVSLSKIITNVGDTHATRYLMSSYTLVGKGQEFKTLIESNLDQVKDVAASVLSTKTIRDLNEPDIRNRIKAELTSTINTALGKPAVKEIYITEFAVQ